MSGAGCQVKEVDLKVSGVGYQVQGVELRVSPRHRAPFGSHEEEGSYERGTPEGFTDELVGKQASKRLWSPTRSFEKPLPSLSGVGGRIKGSEFGVHRQATRKWRRCCPGRGFQTRPVTGSLPDLGLSDGDLGCGVDM